MEHFGARDDRPADECIRLVANESDIFVGIYAHRYGFVPEGADISISEMEYQAACASNLPRFIYLAKDDFPWPPPYIDQGKARKRLSAFKERLLKQHICQRFQTADNLAACVVADIGRHIAMQKAPRVGPGIPVRDIGLESRVHGMHLNDEALQTADDWNSRRRAIYDTSRNIFISHVIRPSSKPGQECDVFIYLIRHHSQSFPQDFSDVGFAEFFLGSAWENRVFPTVEENGFIGISTSAYGTFLCLCRVTFKDGRRAELHRYIDFEAQRTGGAAS
jgi:hypothetical protein